MKKALLVDKNGYTQFELIYDEEHEYALMGTLKKCISWECNENRAPMDYMLMAKFSVKWDGCSHFWFHGEDCELNENGDVVGEEDAYYHICGFNEYINFSRGMVFAYKVAMSEVTEFSDCKSKEYENMKFLLDGYTIVYR